MASCTDPPENTVFFSVLTIGTVTGPTGFTIDTAIVDLGADGCRVFGHSEPGYTVWMRASDSSGSMGSWTTGQPVFGRYAQMRVPVASSSQVDQDSGMLWRSCPKLDTCVFRYAPPTGSTGSTGDYVPTGSPYPFWERVRPLWWPRWSRVYEAGTLWNRVDAAIQRSVYQLVAPDWFGPQEAYYTQSHVWYATLPHHDVPDPLYAVGQRLTITRSIFEFFRCYEPAVFASGSTWLFRNIDRTYVLFSGPDDWDVLPGAAGDMVAEEPVYVKVEERWYRVPEPLVDRANGRVRAPTDRLRTYSYVTHQMRQLVLSLGEVVLQGIRYPLRLYDGFGYLWSHARLSDLPVSRATSVQNLEEQSRLKWAAPDIRWMLAATFFHITPVEWSGAQSMTGSHFLVANRQPCEVTSVRGRRQLDGTYWVPLSAEVAELVADGRRVMCEVSGNILTPTIPVSGESLPARLYVCRYSVSGGTLTPSTNLSIGQYTVWQSDLPEVEVVSGTTCVIWDYLPESNQHSIMDIL